MEQPSVPRRLKALRELAGFTSPKRLAAAMVAKGVGRGLGPKTLYNIEQGRRPADSRDLAAIAETCGVPLSWFTADFSRLDEISEDPRAAIARELAGALERSAEQPEGNSSEPPSQQREGREP